MNNINILVLSDIHFNKMEANDQGLVLSGLFVVLPDSKTSWQ